MEEILPERLAFDESQTESSPEDYIQVNQGASDTRNHGAGRDQDGFCRTIGIPDGDRIFSVMINGTSFLTLEERSAQSVVH